MSYFDKFSQEYADLMERAKDAFADGIKQFLLDNPEVKFVPIYGYTPEFNDGEPCEFNAYILDVVGEDAEGYMYGIPSELADAFVEWSSQYEWDEYSRLFSPLNISAHPIQNVLESMFGYYGFVVIYYLEDGELKFVDGEYDCGY